MRGIYLKVLTPCTDSVDLVLHPGRAVAAQPGLAGKLLSVMLMPLWYPMKALMCLFALVGVLLSATAFIWFMAIPFVVFGIVQVIVLALGGPEFPDSVMTGVSLAIFAVSVVFMFLGGYAAPKIMHWSMRLIGVETDPNEKFEWKSVFERKMEIGGDDYAAGYVAGMSSMH
ncbi:hypothetical protein HCU74_14300 [Spongiibacter sp. KMU-166]|uniref:Uncharacterized protein n=1 Tax=Spongiibacter thalassae TaxID=2721624 RepID=A0ABX1GH97_9GAMM|nr:hypothetical protein [Spongiibacter thalassae]NKI18584.1 hypothetical protein [Spongiibacter thalassae]